MWDEDSETFLRVDGQWDDSGGISVTLYVARVPLIFFSFVHMCILF